jgi:uncharacterized protein (DUF1786 family)
MTLLAVDVGAGTQDILLYQEGVPIEGSTKMVLPSQTMIIGNRISRARMAGRDIFLRGPIMGGGASTIAVRWHLAAGLRVFATPSAAATINNDLSQVEALGVIIQEDAPALADIVETGDIDIPSLQRAFQLFDMSLPKDIAVAVQDHGYSPGKQNRQVRFEHMVAAIHSGGSLEDFAFKECPQEMTRMVAVRDTLIKGGFEPFIMDTGPAAIFGAALDPRMQDPALSINFGNSHTIAPILAEGKVCAIFEHHTSSMNGERVSEFTEKLCRGTLEESEVFGDGGHGSYIGSLPDGVRSILVTGPRRESFLSCEALKGAVAAAPAGDMMITGCLGLIKAWKKRDDLTG